MCLTKKTVFCKFKGSHPTLCYEILRKSLLSLTFISATFSPITFHNWKVLLTFAVSNNR
jgi:hypothetical protein